MTWDEKFISMADLVASWSKDRSTKVGAVIVGSENQVLAVGYNGFPRKVDDEIDARHERPTKYAFTEHAERNAVYNAARSGIRTEWATMYLNWEPYPCPDCARAVIQSGIKRVVGPSKKFPGANWQESFLLTQQMFTEAGIRTDIIHVPGS